LDHISIQPPNIRQNPLQPTAAASPLPLRQVIEMIQFFGVRGLRPIGL
jgi:hypothetical protein